MVSPQPIRSGASNLVANWQVLAISVLETLAGTYALARIVGVVQPLLAEKVQEKTPAVSWGSFFSANWAVVGVTTVLVVLLVAVTVLVNALITGGNAFIYILGSEKASASPELNAYRAFDFRQWWRAGRSAMWRVAGVYAAAFSILLLAVGLIFAVSNFGQGKAEGLSCLVLIFAIPLMMGVGVAFATCVPKAIVLVVGGSLETREALQLAFAQTMERLGAHVGALIVLGLFTSFAGWLVSACSVTTESDMLIASGQLVVSAANGFITIVSTCWLLASMTALTELPESTLPILPSTHSAPTSTSPPDPPAAEPAR